MISEVLIQRLASTRLVVFFTGAGVSAESGVATFRATDGLWAKFKPEELANVDAFLANPRMVWEWCQSRREVVLNARPNAGHHAIAEMERLVPKVAVITQNIDGLHQLAGSTEVVQLHGDIRKNYCIVCQKRYDDEALLTVREVQSCTCGSTIRPDIVWFGEMLPRQAWDRAEQLARQAGVLISVGTSALVYPAAGIPILARRSGAYCAEINPEETPASYYFHESIRSGAGKALTEVLGLLRGAKGEGIF